MKISYNWLKDYLPSDLPAELVTPQNLSSVLTAIGLEVESLEKFESIAGGLAGLVVGEVLECFQHENADKLKVTRVNVGNGEPLQIVCGAPNVAKNQKVIVAMPGVTIHPSGKDPVTMKVAKIRGVESHGMICAEDEIGLSEDHGGIIILPDELNPGTLAADYFKIYTDHLFEIGLTPNRMDAMSHLGVAKDLCAYFSHHLGRVVTIRLPETMPLRGNNEFTVKITVQNIEACPRYAGILLKNIRVKPSPEWLQNRLRSIGQRPLNNVVDVTNYVLHEMGQPLHAFDAAKITGNHVIVKTLSEEPQFISLDNKSRKLSAEDLMICDENGGMCIAGVFGGLNSGVSESTTQIFLESAWFNPINIRKTSFRHDLRTEAAARFEKGVDISNVTTALQRAARLLSQVAGAESNEGIQDVYPSPKQKTQVSLTYSYLKKLSGKVYTSESVKDILVSLGFEILNENDEGLKVNVPFSKSDISIPADLVEEIIRIDGLDSIPVPASINITPSNDPFIIAEAVNEKLSSILTGLGFSEMVNNSITNSKYYPAEQNIVKLLNSLSSELDVLRPTMLPTALESIAYNIHRKNYNLQFFEFGKTYHEEWPGKYTEVKHLCLYVTGNRGVDEWRNKSQPLDFFACKGFVETILRACGINNFQMLQNQNTENGGLNFDILYNNKKVGTIQQPGNFYLQQFDIKQPVVFADLQLAVLQELIQTKSIKYKEVVKFPSVTRDLAVTLNKDVNYQAVQEAVEKLQIPVLQKMHIFDIFESEKLGNSKKSITINFTLQNVSKTLTDVETDEVMQKIMQQLQSTFGAEVRK